MSRYTSVLMTAGIGNREALTWFAAQWAQEQKGEVSLAPNGAVLFLERNYLDESALRDMMRAVKWDHPEWVQVWFWREGDGEWTEMQWRSGEWASVHQAITWRAERAERLLVKISRGESITSEEAGWVQEMREAADRKQRQTEAEIQWRKDWDAVIDRHAQGFIKESA